MDDDSKVVGAILTSSDEEPVTSATKLLVDNCALTAFSKAKIDSRRAILIANVKAKTFLFLNREILLFIKILLMRRL